MLIHWAKI